MIGNPELGGAIERAARAVARRYGSFVTYEDLVQDGWEWALSAGDRLEHYELKDGTVYRNGLVTDLIRDLTKIAKRAREMTLGQRKGDQYNYDRATVESVLPAIWDPGFRPPAVETGMRSTSDPATASMSWEALVLDVREAYGQLHDRQRRVLLAYWGVNPVGGWREAATALGMSKTAANNIGNEAVGQMVDILNGVPDDDLGEQHIVGTRRVISNAQARAITSNQWDGID